jgi:DNA gyrase subunit B
VDTLDSAEYERLLEYYPKLEPYLAQDLGVDTAKEVQDTLLLIVENQDEQHVETFDALKTIVEERGKKGLSVQRFKGLGEMMPAQLWDTTMNPETRTLLRVEISEAAMADRLFDILMGERVEPRRQFIEANAHLVKNLDV